jgi:hypothetical protein
LKIDEYELYEAIVKWASIRAKNEQLEISPSNLRTAIGPQILKKVRFLTMTSAEFSRVYMGFKILSYDEILPIIFNINDKNSVPLPDTISASTEHRRNSVPNTFLTFNSIDSCNVQNPEEGSNYDIVHFSPKGIVLTDGETITAVKVQIPMSIESSQSCCEFKEHFDILVFNKGGENILRKSFNGFPGCSADGMINCNGTEDNSEKLIDVELNNITLENYYSIQVEFYDSLREYPKMHVSQDVSICKPRYINKYNHYYGRHEQKRDDETESKCVLNEFISLTYY